MMLPTSRRYTEQAFGPRVFAGFRGMGATAAEVSALAAEVAAGGGAESEAAYKAALTSYYSAGGTYSQAESVKEAASEPDASVASGPREMPVPMLYAARDCGPNPFTAGDCIAFNALVANANIALMENARRAFFLQVCEANAALNPESVRQPCEQYRETVPVPLVEGKMQPAVCAGGQCYTPILGDTGAVTKSQQEVQKQYAAQYTPTGAPRTQVGVPNQTVPPRPQPGEVPATTYVQGPATEGAGGEAVADGGLFGFDAKTLLIGGAALVGVFLLAKGKG